MAHGHETTYLDVKMLLTINIVTLYHIIIVHG